MKSKSSSRRNSVEGQTGSSTEAIINTPKVTVTQEPLQVYSQTTKLSDRSSTITLSHYETSGSATSIIMNSQQITVAQESLHVSSQTPESSGRSSTVTLSQYEASAPNIVVKWSSFALALSSVLPFIF